ncbi:hypothetical protein CEXT_797201 [Caerostris extrusa]|uniref:Secreted protein n=1 Tax=Caerostris extrusa TaxID=172846 RepID=A0AAV4RF23_CAEEX|nr:hypothetical protein CEXT_797201 [Caerostris extrusa]
MLRGKKNIIVTLTPLSASIHVCLYHPSSQSMFPSLMLTELDAEGGRYVREGRSGHRIGRKWRWNGSRQKYALSKHPTGLRVMRGWYGNTSQGQGSPRGD